MIDYINKAKINKFQSGGRTPTQLYNTLNPGAAYSVGGFFNNGLLYSFKDKNTPRTGKLLSTPEEEAY